MSDRNEQTVKQPRRGLFPPEVIEVVSPSLGIGAIAGTFGFATGVAGGIARDATPALFGLSAGIQWFTLGTSYWLTRSVVLKSWGAQQSLTSSDKTKASAIAGGVSGLVGGLLRGPKNIIPGAIVFTLLGGGGQAMANQFAASGFSRKESKSILESKWSPLRKISDDEYKEMLGEKILRLDADIALIDDKIAELRAADQKASEVSLTKGEHGRGQG